MTTDDYTMEILSKDRIIYVIGTVHYNKKTIYNITNE